MLDELDSALGLAASSLCELCERYRGLADRLLGTQPEPAKSGNPIASNPPIMRRLADDAEVLNALASDLRAQLNRLERL